MENVSKREKFNIIVRLLILVFLFIMVIGVGYSYYLKKVKNYTNKKVVKEAAQMMVTFKGNNQINANGIMPGWHKSITFSVKNFSEKVSGKYKIVFEITTPLTDKPDEAFVYYIESKTASTKKDNILVKKDEEKIPISTTDIGIGQIAGESEHEYTINIDLKNIDGDQNYLMGKIFIGKINVVNVYE